MGGSQLSDRPRLPQFQTPGEFETTAGFICWNIELVVLKNESFVLDSPHSLRHGSDAQLGMIHVLRSSVPSSGIKASMIQLDSTGSQREFKESLLNLHLSARVLAESS